MNNEKLIWSGKIISLYGRKKKKKKSPKRKIEELAKLL